MENSLPSKLYQAAQSVLDASSSLELKQLVSVFQGLLVIPDLINEFLVTVSSDAPSHQLLWLQYAYETYDEPHEKLMKVFMPFLEEASPVDGDLIEAALDAANLRTVASSEELHKAIRASKGSLYALSRMLVRLMTHSVDKGAIRQLATEVFIQRLPTIHNDASIEVLHGVIRPFVEDLVPMLQESPSHLLLIYEALATDMLDRRDENALATSTVVLCSILPLVERSALQQDTKLWKLIDTCLQRGLSLEIAKQEDSLLRRRGLFILRVLVGDDINTWKHYAACFETIEMENELHLIEQVWPTVASLGSSMTLAFAEEAPPTMSWHWMSLLLRRSILSPNVPSVRKLALYRLFCGEIGIATDEDNSEGFALSLVPPSFVIDTVLVSFDTLEPSVGASIHFQEGGKRVRYDLNEMLERFLSAYMLSIDDESLSVFLTAILSNELIQKLRDKSVVELFAYIATSVQEVSVAVAVSESTLEETTQSLHDMFTAEGGISKKYKESLRQSFAMILGKVRTSKAVSPKTLLSILALFDYLEPEELQSVDNAGLTWVDNDETFRCLKAWLDGFGDSTSTGSTVATAFVDGMLKAPGGLDTWKPESGISSGERQLAKSIAMLCALGAHNSSPSTTASQLLWPAIHKGLAHSARAILPDSALINADRVDRAIALLVFGCELFVLSGLGNGDLVVDKKTGQMMPPPASVENMLASAVSFLLAVVAQLSRKPKGNDGQPEPAGRSGKTRQFSSAFRQIISQINILSKSFPSSLILTESVASFVDNGVEAVMAASSKEGHAVLSSLCLLFAGLTCGGTIDEKRSLKLCEKLLLLQFEDRNARRKGAQSERSVFEYAKWGIMWKLVSTLRTTAIEGSTSIMNKLSTNARRAIEAVPPEAFVPLFGCILEAARYRVHLVSSEADTKQLEKTSKTIFALLAEMKKSKDYVRLLDEVCSFFFSPRLLQEEADRLKEKYDAASPICSAFQSIQKAAGAKKPYMLHIALGRLCAGWLHSPEAGATAVPYADTIVELLLFKEDLVSDAHEKQSRLSHSLKQEHLSAPAGTDSQSVVRAILLVYLSRLPSELSKQVQHNLVSHVIMEILRSVHPKKGESLSMKGTTAYCTSMRGFQALCVLSRFVDKELAPLVCEGLFPCLAENLHGQVRYFVEMFTLQCMRKHPLVFGDRLFAELRQPNLNLQQVSSLMIIAGNVLVGRYENDFLEVYKTESKLFSIPGVLSCVLPWLSSTQSFTRAIAQLLCHKLIPLCLDITVPESEQGSNRYASRVYQFLDGNAEMKRLRRKQSKFFEEYDADSVCTPEGVMRIPLDESREANPECLIDAVKVSLQDTFEDTRTNVSPAWKQIEDILEKEREVIEGGSSGDVNFQRKIIPMDALNLALEAERDKRRRNIAGRRKQELIVCASLVDKVPNLGGLARTSEIFAAARLVIPDLRVTKMDNFQSISVGAGEWIDIEECREKDLINWLHRHRVAGWYIVGVEQTSSSQSLITFDFPVDRPIVLLLGKEKEGIPVELLSFVDVALEIPQLGLIRSLNVHVSGALTIWELTRQRFEKGELDAA